MPPAYQLGDYYLYLLYDIISHTAMIDIFIIIIYVLALAMPAY